MSRILLLISKQSNRKLLQEWLHPRYHVMLGAEPEALDGGFDLCIMDGPALERSWAQIQKRRERELPVLLPFLLVTSREDLGLASRHLWRTVEDVVIQPVHKIELQARVEVLLHAGELSRQNHRQARILEMIALKTPLPVILESIGEFVEQETRFTRDCVVPEMIAVPTPQVVAAGALRSRLESHEGWIEGERDQATLDCASHLARLAIDQERYDKLRSHQLSYLTQGMADGVAAVDGHGRLVALNPAARHLLKVPAEAELCHPLHHVVPGLLADALETIAKGGATQTLHLTVDSTEISVLVSALGGESPGQGAIALIRDVSEDARYRRLQESLIANTSHELRAPLATISATLEAVVDGLVPQAEQTKYLRGVVAEVARLRRLSEDIIGLSKLDHGIVALHPIPFDLGLILESVELIWSPHFNNAGVRLVLESETVYVVADYDRVEQLIGNLLENAVRHTPAGGAVMLSARVESGFARISVADSGIGIPSEHLPFLWDRFYKVDHARTRTQQGGSGLGLAIVKELAERMGGSVFVESRPGGGSTFGFTLPVAQ